MNALVQSYCRFCAELKQENLLVDFQEHFVEIASKLSRIHANIDFESKILPTTVCFACLLALNGAFDLVNKIERAQVTLVKIFVRNAIKEEVSTLENTGKELIHKEFLKTEDSTELEIKNDEFDTSEFQFDGNKPEVPSNSNPTQVSSDETYKSEAISNSTTLNHKSSWKDFPWICSECGTQFPTQSELTGHSIKYHSSCNTFCCPDCNVRKGHLNKLLAHVKQHRPSLGFSCHVCFKIFSSARGITRHKCDIKRTTHKCMGCNTRFDDHEELKKHTSTYFKHVGYPSTLLAKADFDSLTCKECKKSFKIRSHLMSHLKVHSERKRDYTCEACGKCFYNIYILTQHMITHTDKRPFQCDICKQRFKTKIRVAAHVRTHDDEKSHVCDQCGRRFRLKRQLESHSIIHTDLRPHVCSYCNKAFRFASILRQHLRQHTGHKPYSCDMCDRDFTVWPNYNKHMKRMHNLDMAFKEKRKRLLVDVDKVVETELSKKYTRCRGRPKIINSVKDVYEDNC